MNTNKKVSIMFEENPFDVCDYGEVDNKQDFLNIMSDVWDNYQKKSVVNVEHFVKLVTWEFDN